MVKHSLSFVSTVELLLLIYLSYNSSNKIIQYSLLMNMYVCMFIKKNICICKWIVSDFLEWGGAEAEGGGGGVEQLKDTNTVMLFPVSFFPKRKKATSCNQVICILFSKMKKEKKRK